MDLLNSWLASIIRSIDKLNLSRSLDNVVLASVLITISVSSDNNWLSPARYKSWNVRDNNWLSEDGSVEDVSNRAIGRSPHFFEAEFFHSALVRSDSSAFDTDLCSLHGLGAVDCDLIIGGISVGYREVIVLSLNIDVWVNMLKHMLEKGRHLPCL